MIKWINRVIDLITDLFWIFMAGLIWGTVGGIVIFIAFAFTRYGFIYALLVTAFFSIFHLSDFKRFILNRNWMAFTGRAVCLYSICAFIGGLVALASGLILPNVDQIDMYVMILCFLISYAGIFFWLILNNFFYKTRFYKNLFEIVDGLHVIGVLWRNY